MNFDNKTYLYSIDKELTIRTQKKFLKKNITELKAISNISEEKTDKEIIYKIKEIKHYNKFLYIIAQETNRFIFEIYFKGKLKENFENYKEIYANHRDRSYENSYMEFLIKSKLLLFFKFNDELNIPTFLLFNCQKAYEEFDLIIESEIECDGCLYDELELDDEDIKTITNRYNSLFKYISGKQLKNEIFDISIYKEGKGIKIVNENGTLLNSKQTGIDFNDIKDFYIKTCNKEATDIDSLGFYLAAIIALSDAERIIIYDSIHEEFKDQIFKDLGILKQVMSINTECYVSEEKKPRK